MDDKPPQFLTGQSGTEGEADPHILIYSLCVVEGKAQITKRAPKPRVIIYYFYIGLCKTVQVNLVKHVLVKIHVNYKKDLTF